jgi:hypothetical protein
MGFNWKGYVPDLFVVVPVSVFLGIFESALLYLDSSMNRSSRKLWGLEVPRDVKTLDVRSSLREEA